MVITVATLVGAANFLRLLPLFSFDTVTFIQQTDAAQLLAPTAGKAGANTLAPTGKAGALAEEVAGVARNTAGEGHVATVEAACACAAVALFASFLGRRFAAHVVRSGGRRACGGDVIGHDGWGGEGRHVEWRLEMDRGREGMVGEFGGDER